MKYISQMIEDGSFDRDFVTSYQKAYEDNKPIFTYAGTKYAVSYAKTIIDFVNDLRSDMNTFKKLEK